MSELATIGKYKPYPAYKDSGIEWLGQVPEHWCSKALKLMCSSNDDVLSEKTDSDYEVEYVDISSVSAIEGISNTDKMPFGKSPSRARRQVRHGDVIVSTVRTYLEAIAPIVNPPENMVVSTGFAVIRPKSMFEKGFAAYCLRAKGFIGEVVSRSVGVSYPAINASELVNINVPYLPFEEQKQIASFLDQETSKIDSLIEKQQKLIELLKEKRQAVISHAVTKGLNPNAKMKDSGIQWLGHIPEHWEVSSLKYLFANLDFRRIPISSSDREHMSGEYPYYGASGIIDYVNSFIFDEETVLVGEDGANLVMRSTPLAFVAKGKYWVNNHAHILKFYDSLNSFWINVINNLDIKPFVSGSAQPKLTAEALGNLVVAYPVDLDERKQIVQHIDTQTQKIDTLIDKSQQAIELLKERKTALISAAVTGKIDVREKVSD